MDQYVNSTCILSNITLGTEWKKWQFVHDYHNTVCLNDFNQTVWWIKKRQHKILQYGGLIDSL